MVPDEVRQLLAPSAPWPVPWDQLNIILAPVPEALAMANVPCSRILVPHALMRVLARGRSGAYALKIMGATIGNTVYLNIKPEDLKTAAGLALAAHELFHVRQGQEIPDFDRVYSLYADSTPPQKPWLNPLEMEAYRVEATEYCRLVDLGYPPGRWTPLGVQLWGCG